jgi:hypothetical protein
VDDIAEIPELLVDPQPDVGGTGEQPCLRLREPQARQLFQSARCGEAIAAARRHGARCRVGERATRQFAQRGRSGLGGQALHRRIEHALAGVEDRPVAGAATQVARDLVGQLLTRRLLSFADVALVARGERHHEARCAEAALRAVAVDHRPLHRVQCAIAGRSHVFDREQRLAV